ncbi:DUF167 domain-containing protein [Thermincola ferriacetica]|nr:DUF167 domain-containing protein [Thermincola ferriacetica]
MLIIEQHSDGITFKIKVQPKASKNELKGVQGDSLKVKLTAPPVEGAANEACIRFFAELFSVAKSQVEIITGHTSRTKLLKVKGLTKEEAEKRLNL